MELVDYRLDLLAVPCDPPVTDANYGFDTAGLTVLELETRTGEVGVGLGWTDADQTPAGHARRFEAVWSAIEGESPFALAGRLRPPTAFADGFRLAVDSALWDLRGKHHGEPVYRLMGADDPRVPAYASGLAFRAPDDRVRDLYGEFAEQGFDAAKVKVGYDAVERDLERLELAHDALGSNATLAADANTVWDAAEAIQRGRAYREAGVDLAWLEDPTPTDPAVLRRVVEGLPATHVNAGEYTDFAGKCRLVREEALDAMNVRSDLLTGGLAVASLAEGANLALHVGHVPFELGVHVAAAIDAPWVEYWGRPWDRLTDAGVRVEDGHLVAPDRPGHGIALDRDAVERHRVEA